MRHVCSASQTGFTPQLTKLPHSRLRTQTASNLATFKVPLIDGALPLHARRSWFIIAGLVKFGLSAGVALQRRINDRFWLGSVRENAEHGRTTALQRTAYLQYRQNFESKAGITAWRHYAELEKTIRSCAVVMAGIEQKRHADVLQIWDGDLAPTQRRSITVPAVVDELHRREPRLRRHTPTKPC